MLKGSRRQMLVLRTCGSRYFDEAYLVLRSGMTPTRAGKRDILAEANRILDEASVPYKRRHVPSAILFFLGSVCGISVGGLIFVLLARCGLLTFIK